MKEVFELTSGLLPYSSTHCQTYLSNHVHFLCLQVLLPQGYIECCFSFANSTYFDFEKGLVSSWHLSMEGHLYSQWRNCYRCLCQMLCWCSILAILPKSQQPLLNAIKHAHCFSWKMKRFGDIAYYHLRYLSSISTTCSDQINSRLKTIRSVGTRLLLA